jgi:hypothetical protein
MDSMPCPVCGSENPPNTRMCSTCGYLLASGPIPEAPRGRKIRSEVGPDRRPVSTIERVENSRKWMVLALVVVIVVILASFYLYVQLHKDDALLSATLFYRYVPASGSNSSYVHVWGDVYNWGSSEGSGKLTIVITDDQGHRSQNSFKVGPVSPHDSVDIDKSYPWDYSYGSAEQALASIEVSFTI